MYLAWAVPESYLECKQRKHIRTLSRFMILHDVGHVNNTGVPVHGKTYIKVVRGGISS